MPGHGCVSRASVNQRRAPFSDSHELVLAQMLVSDRRRRARRYAG